MLKYFEETPAYKQEADNLSAFNMLFIIWYNDKTSKVIYAEDGKNFLEIVDKLGISQNWYTLYSMPCLIPGMEFGILQ